MTVPPPAAVDPWNWYYRLVAGWVAIIHLAVGGCLIFGPERWFQRNSLHVIHTITHISWLVWGGVFLALGVMIATGRWRKRGYLTSIGVTAVFDIASFGWMCFTPHSSNPVLVLFSTFSILLMLAGVKYCAQQVIPAEVARRLKDTDGSP